MSPKAIATASYSGDACPHLNAKMAVGEFPDQSAEYGMWQGKAVQITCSVKSSGDHFLVDTSISFEGNSIGINGSVSPTEPSELLITYAKLGAGEYKSKDCTLEYPTDAGVASGRFWGRITCPAGAEVNEKCGINVEARVEDCAE